MNSEEMNRLNPRKSSKGKIWLSQHISSSDFISIKQNLKNYNEEPGEFASFEDYFINKIWVDLAAISNKEVFNLGDLSDRILTPVLFLGGLSRSTLQFMKVENNIAFNIDNKAIALVDEAAKIVFLSGEEFFFREEVQQAAYGGLEADFIMFQQYGMEYLVMSGSSTMLSKKDTVIGFMLEMGMSFDYSNIRPAKDVKYRWDTIHSSALKQIGIYKYRKESWL